MRLRPVLCAGLLALIVDFGVAEGSGINFSWNACTSEGGVQNKTFACNTNTTTNVLVGSFVLGSDMDNFIGIEALVDISADADSLPPWWRAFGPQKCRATLASSFVFQSDPNENCLDPWSAQGTGATAALHSYWSDGVMPGGSPATAQVVLVAAVPSTLPIGLAGSVEYYGFKITVTSVKTVGSNACGGCDAPVCLTLSHIKAVGADNRYELLTEPVSSRTVTWQSATGCVGPFVPEENVTWGQIRALMR